MLQLQNTTPFKASIAVLPDRAGIDTLYVVVKATLSLRPKLSSRNRPQSDPFAPASLEPATPPQGGVAGFQSSVLLRSPQAGTPAGLPS